MSTADEKTAPAPAAAPAARDSHDNRPENPAEPMVINRPNGWIYRGVRVLGHEYWFASPKVQLLLVSFVCSYTTFPNFYQSSPYKHKHTRDLTFPSEQNMPRMRPGASISVPSTLKPYDWIPINTSCCQRQAQWLSRSCAVGVGSVAHLDVCLLNYE